MNIYITRDLHDHLEQKDDILSKDFKRWFLEMETIKRPMFVYGIWERCYD